MEVCTVLASKFSKPDKMKHDYLLLLTYQRKFNSWIRLFLDISSMSFFTGLRRLRTIFHSPKIMFKA